MFNTLPGYLNLMNCTNLGYKKVMLPHIEVDPRVGITYSLSPSPRWIDPISFVKDWSTVKRWDVVPAFVTNRFMEVFNPCWRIGALADCDLPRSSDGLSLLHRRENKGLVDSGWCNGSSNPDVVPKSIRENLPKVPAGNHQEIFANYKSIHMHGGAGTVQTAIACGATPIIHDEGLDRKYHKVPTPNDFRQPSVAPFMGWLVWSGFDVKAPWVIKVLWVMSFMWNRRSSLTISAIYDALKFYTLCSYLYNHWAFALILIFTVPTIFWRVLWRTQSIGTVARLVTSTLWQFPVFCLLESRVAFVISVLSLKHLWMRALQDWSNNKVHRTSLIFEPVSRGGIDFPFPFGHWAIKDEVSGELYEGRFTERGRATMQAPFQFQSSKRELHANARIFRAPFDVLTAKKALKGPEKPYGPRHNCATLVLGPLWARGMFWSLVATIISGMIALALQPPDVLLSITKFLFPDREVENTPLFQKWGFAAGIQGTPLEPEDDQLATDNLAQPAEEVEEEKTFENLKRPESLEALYAEISLIQNTFARMRWDELEDDDFREAAERTFAHKMEEVIDKYDPMVETLEVPTYVKHTWAQIVDSLHEAIYFVRQNALVDSFIAKVKVSENNIRELIAPVLMVLSSIANLALRISKDHFNKVWVAACHLMDHVWGLKLSTRVKTVWGLTGIYKTGTVGAAMRLAMSVKMAEYEGRTSFIDDYAKFTQLLIQNARELETGHYNRVGGLQRRPVRFSKPLMTHQEAELLGFTKDEYVSDPTYQERVDSYIADGVKQGADGVFLSCKNPDLIAKSQHRYEPKYPDLTAEDRYLAEEIAKALVRKYPEVYTDTKVVTMGSVRNYIKPKYSPGTPFIGEKGFKTRQAMFDAGFDKVLQKTATSLLETGKYPVQFYHAFVKSQVVDIQQCLPVARGGKDKNVRTVVSQDLLTYFMDQCLQIERNKRRNWDTFGAGIGMPLNQSMEQIFSEMADRKKEVGGRYIIADAREFDSYCKPFLSCTNHHLWRLGFKNHPSGNGEALASVLKASYDARQNAWIIGVTEPEFTNLLVSIADHDLRKKVEQRHLPNVLPLADFIDFQVFNNLGIKDQQQYVRNLNLPSGKVLVSWRPDLRPKDCNWMGEYKLDPNYSTVSDVLDFQTFKYPENETDRLINDIKALGMSNIRLLSNVHAKNRGGSTGGSDTSNYNTNMYKAGIIRAWCLTTGRKPIEFFDYNTLYNTSDDTVWHSGGKFGLESVEQVEQFKHHAEEVGIHLTIESTKDISQVEYLSKFVREPTPEDSEVLKIWRTQKIHSIQQAHKALGRPVPATYEELNNPRFIVVQNPKAILMRRSAFRYYQSNGKTWRYHSIERGSGHANNTAFVPELYCRFAKEWCDDVNHLMNEMGIHQRWKLNTNGQYNLPTVEQRNPNHKEQALSERQVAFLKWLKGNMFPSYLKVVNIHMNVSPPDPLYHEKLLRKLQKGWRGYSEIIAEGVDGLFAATDAIPDEWSKKFNGQIDMLYAEVPFYTKNQIVEKFVFLKMMEETPDKEISFSDFTSRLNESPYAGVCDPYHFYETLRDGEKRKSMLEEDTIKYQGMVLFISGLYMVMTWAEWFLLGVPFLGSFYKLFLWSFIGLNKVYGITNTAYWHSTGKSSREISRIHPRDPYLVSKCFCAFLVDFIPLNAGYLALPVIAVLDAIPSFFELVGKLWYMAGEVKQSAGHTQNAPVENPWSRYADEYIERVRTETPVRKAYVAAGTGTGKSTWFIAALWQARHRQNVRKIWLIEPRKVLRDETNIPFGIQSQVLKKGVDINRSIDIYIMTYGHLQSRIYEIDPDRDLVLFDEFHELQGEMILGLETVPCPLLLLSATPAEIPSLSQALFFTPSIKRRHPITVHQTEKSMSVIDMFMMASNQYPDLIDRSLVIVPTHKELKKTVAALEYLKVGPVFPLSARERKVPDFGIIVATPYVQTGLDIKPPPKLLIDCGKDIVIDKGVFVHPLPWTDPDVNKQREGRVGRLQPGVVYRPKSAGTGKKATFYPSPNQFIHKCVAEHFKVPQLTPAPVGECQEMPFFMINNRMASSPRVRKSIAMVHAIALTGVQEAEIQSFYERRRGGECFDEDHEYLNRVYSNPKWSRLGLMPWDEVQFHVNRRGITLYSINYNLEERKPLKVINGQWVDVSCSETPMKPVRVSDEFVESKFLSLQKKLDKVKSFTATAVSKWDANLADTILSI
jgi:hypothetical protein